MRIARLDINIKPLSIRETLGKATALLRSMAVDPAVTVLLTTLCDISCAHCYSPKEPADIDPEIVRETAEELRGSRRLYFSGGEPLQYAAHERNHEQIFMDLTHHVAARVGRLFIDTNGSFLPSDPAGAISYLNQFPKNVTFILSLDQYHADALSRKGKSLMDIFKVLRSACRENGLGLELNARLKRADILANERRLKLVGGPHDVLAEYFHFDPRLPGLDPVHVNSVFSHGAARGLPDSETKPVSVKDFVEHLFTVSGIGLFVTPAGLVTGGDHAAFLRTPPPFAVLGDLKTQTLAKIIWDKFIPGYQRVYQRVGIYELERIFAEPDAREIYNLSQTQASRNIPPEDIAALVHDDSQRIDWLVDPDLPGATVRRIISGFSEEEIDRVASGPAKELADFLLETSAKGLIPEAEFKLLVRKGKPILEMALHTYDHKYETMDYLKIFWEICNRFSGYFRGTRLHASFFKAMYDNLMDRLHQLNDRDRPNFANLKILLGEIGDRLDDLLQAEELVAAVRGDSFPLDWVIGPFYSGNTPALRKIDEKILESYGKGVPEKSVKEEARRFIDQIFKGEIDWRPLVMSYYMRYCFVVRKGDLRFEGEKVLLRDSYNQRQGSLERFVSFIDDTFRYFAQLWPGYKRYYFEAIIDCLRNVPVSQPGQILVKGIEEKALYYLGQS